MGSGQPLRSLSSLSACSAANKAAQKKPCVLSWLYESRSVIAYEKGLTKGATRILSFLIAKETAWWRLLFVMPYFRRFMLTAMIQYKVAWRCLQP